MAEFDLDNYFRTRAAENLGLSNEPVAAADSKINALVQAREAKLQKLEENRLKDEAYKTTLAGRAGLERGSLPADVVDFAAASFDEAINLPGQLPRAALNLYADAEESATAPNASAAFQRELEGQASEADQALLDQEEFVAGGGSSSNRSRLERAKAARDQAAQLKQALDFSSLVGTDDNGAKTAGAGRRLGDVAVTGAKGAVSLGDAIIGVGDLVSGGYVGKGWEELGRDSQQTQEFLDTFYSEQQQSANQNLQSAEGFWNTIEAGIDNPSVIPHGILQSLPAMLAGGGFGRELALQFPKVAAFIASKPQLAALASRVPGSMSAGVAGSVGEGTMMAGSLAEGIRENTEDGLLTAEQAGLAALGGVVGGAVGLGGNKLARALGVGDIDEAVVDGSLKALTSNRAARTAIGGGIEMGEEVVQSGEEQVMRNLALDKQWDEGVDSAMGQGALLGGPMGAGMNLISPSPKREPKEDEAGSSSTPASIDEQVRALSQEVRAADTPEQRSEVRERTVQVLDSIGAKIEETQAALEAAKPEALRNGEALLARQQEVLAAETDPAKRTQREAIINQIAAQVEKERKAFEAAEPALVKELKRLGVQQTRLNQHNEVLQRADVPATEEIRADIERANAPASEESTAAADRVITLAMQSPEFFDPQELQALASNTSNGLSESQRTVLRTFAEAKALEHQFKGLKGVQQNIYEGNQAEGYRGLKEYEQTVSRALNRARPNFDVADKQLTTLQAFADSRQAKAAAATQAFEEIKAAGKGQQQWVRDAQGTWMLAPERYSDAQMYEMGGMTIHKGSGPYVARVQQETQAVTKTLSALQAQVAHVRGKQGFAAPVEPSTPVVEIPAVPVEQPVAQVPEAAEPVAAPEAAPEVVADAQEQEEETSDPADWEQYAAQANLAAESVATRAIDEKTSSAEEAPDVLEGFVFRKPAPAITSEDDSYVGEASQFVRLNAAQQQVIEDAFATIEMVLDVQLPHKTVDVFKFQNQWDRLTASFDRNDNRIALPQELFLGLTKEYGSNEHMEALHVLAHEGLHGIYDADAAAPVIQTFAAEYASASNTGKALFERYALTFENKAKQDEEVLSEIGGYFFSNAEVLQQDFPDTYQNFLSYLENVQTSNESPSAVTGELAAFSEEDPVLTEDTEDARYRQLNGIKRFFIQVSGAIDATDFQAPKAGRPLVMLKDFVSRWLQDDRLIEQFLPEGFLEKATQMNPLGGALQFRRLVQEWMPAIQQGLTLPNPSYRYKDPFSYFIRNVDGQPVIDENLMTAMVYAGSSWVAEEVANGAYNRDRDINGILRRDGKTPPSPQEFKLLGPVGTTEDLVYNALGQRVMQVLGFKALPSAPASERAKLEASMGAHVAGVLAHLGLLEKVAVTREQLEEASPGSTAGLNAPVLTFLRISSQEDDNGRLQFNDQAQAIAGVYRGSGNIMAKVLGTEYGMTEPDLLAPERKRGTTSNTTQLEPKALADQLAEDVQRPFVVRRDTLQSIRGISRSALEAMAGVVDIANVRIPKGLLASVIAKNEALLRDLNNALEYLAFIENQTDGQEVELFMPRSVWKHHRVGMDGNVLNPQASKIARHLVGMKAWNQTVDLTQDAAVIDQLKLAIMEGLGTKTDKQPNSKTLAQFDQWLKAKETQQVLGAIQATFDGVPMTPVREQQLLAMVKLKGEKLFTYDALVSAAAYNQALINQRSGEGSTTFETRFFREVDGKTNGSMLAHLQLAPFASLESAWAFLNRGGFYQKGSAYTLFSEFRGDAQAGNMDIYERVVKDVFANVQGILKEASEKQRAFLTKQYDALWRTVGNPIKGEDATSDGRNLVKQPTTGVVYGAGISGTLRGMQSEFVEKLYTRLMRIANDDAKAGDSYDTWLKDVNDLLFMGQQKGQNLQLPPRLSIERALNLEFSGAQEKALHSAYSKLMHKPVKSAMDANFGIFMERRNLLNQAAQMSFEIYEAVRQQEEAAELERQVASGTVAKDYKGNPLHVLSAEQLKRVDDKVAQLLPAAHSLFSMDSQNLKEAILMSKTDREISAKSSHSGEAQFSAGYVQDIKAPGSNSKGNNLKFAGFEQMLVNPGVAALVLLTQSIDSAISAKAYAKLHALNIHDAHILGLQDALAGGKNLNQATFEATRDFSLPGQLDDMLERALQEFLPYAEQPELMTEGIIKTLADFIKRNFDGEARDSEASKAFSSLQQKVRSTRIAADRMRLEILENLDWVDQYSMEGGNYQLSAEDLASVAAQKQALETDVIQRAPLNLTPLNAQVTQPLKAELQAREEKRQQEQAKRSGQTAVVTPQTPAQNDNFEAAVPAAAPVVQKSAWGQLGTPLVNHDQALVEFFKANKTPALREVVKVLRRSIEARTDSPTKEAYRELWKGVLKAVNPQLQVIFIEPGTPVPADVDSSKLAGARGFFHASKNGDFIYAKSPDFVRSGITDELLLHELVHAAVARLINQAESGKATAEVQELYDELKTVLDKANEFAQKQGLAGKWANALQSVQELVAWGMTNTAFQSEVLEGFSMQTKTSKNRLVKAWEVFTKTLRDILFRGSDKSAQKIQVTGLKTLIANVSGLMAAAEERQVRNEGQTITQAYEDDARFMDVTDLFDALADEQQPLEAGFENHLRDVIETVIRPLYGSAGVVRQEVLENTSTDATQEFLNSLAAGEAPLAAQLTGTVNLSNQEALLAESVEVSVRTALDAQDRSVSVLQGELRKLYAEVKKRFYGRPEAFYQDDWATASPQDKAQAQALHDFFLKIPEGTGASDHLSRFAALGLSYAPIANLLTFGTAREPLNLQGKTLMERLQAIVARLMQWLGERITDTWAGQQADAKLMTLVKGLVRIEAKHREQALRPRAEWLERAEAFMEQATDKGRDLVLQATQSKVIKDSRFQAVRVLGRVTNLVGQNAVDDIVDRTQQLSDRIKQGKQGFVSGVFTEAKGVGIALLELMNLAKVNEQHRSQLNEWTQTSVLESFAAPLAQEDRKALGKFLRTDAGALLLQGTSLEQLDTLLTSPTQLDAKIKELEAKLATSEHRDMYLRRTRALGMYLATGKASIDNLMKNADNIARMWVTPQSGTVSEAAVQQYAPIIDQLASLHALKALPEDVKATTSRLIQQEQARTDGGNGMDFTLRLHQALLKQAQQKLFQGSQALVTKGYVPEILNPHVEIVAADAATTAVLLTEGWREISEQLKQDPDDVTEQRTLLVREGAGMLRRVSGALSFTGMKAKGSEMHSGLYNAITGAPNAHNILLTQQQAQAKMAREQSRQSQGLDTQGAYMIPVLNAQGYVTGYRYEMANAVRDTLLDRNSNVEKLLGTLNAQTFDKEASQTQNAVVIQALYDQWQAEKASRGESYLLVGPNSPDAEGQENWRLLSAASQAEIRKVWGGNNMMIRNDQLDLVMGYRKQSLSSLFDKGPRMDGLRNVVRKRLEDERDLKQRLFVWMIEDVFRLKGKAALRVRQAEDVWQALVQEVKDIVVIRSGVTLYWNMVSNATLLLWQGVPPMQIYRNHLVAWKGAVSYRKDSTERFQLETRLATGTSNNPAEDKQRIRELQDALARNPARELIEAGMLPTIVEDVAITDDGYGYRSAAQEWMDGKTQWLHPQVKSFAKSLYLAPGTDLYKALSQATQYSDFMSRYTLYQHLTGKAKNPMGKDEALKRISDSFINYDLPSERNMQYLNDMGIFMFTKYYLRIQRVLMQTFKEHPARALLLVTLDQYLNGVQTVMDSSMLNHLGNPFQWGALQLPGSLDELLSINALTALFK